MFDKVLAAITRQVGSFDELILVDNNSKDDTIKHVSEFCTRNKISVKILINTIPGVATSRKMGILEARTDIAVFIDDDNELTADYLKKGINFLKDKSNVHMLVCKSVLPPNIDVSDIELNHMELKHYAVGQITNVTKSILDKDFVWSAGMFFRVRTLQRFFNQGLALVCGSSNGIMAGEDTELFYWLKIKRLDVWFNTNINFIHHIDSKRLNREYFNNLRFTQKATGETLIKTYGNILRFRSAQQNLKIKFSFYDLRRFLFSFINMVIFPKQMLLFLKVLKVNVV